MKMGLIPVVVLLAGCFSACGDGILKAAVSTPDDVDSGTGIEDSAIGDAADSGVVDSGLGDTATGADTADSTGIVTDTGTGTDTNTPNDDTDTDTASAFVPVIVAGEAEAYDALIAKNDHEWVLVTETNVPDVPPDGDGSHAATASGGAYLEVLPDLIENDSDTGSNTVSPANAPQVLYAVTLSQPGRYYVWVRGWTSGGKDNSVHVGMDGSWPDSGQNMQFDRNTNAWVWSSNQRDSGGTLLGVPNTIFLDVETAGPHELVFAMREDGFEMDQWVLTNDIAFVPGP